MTSKLTAMAALAATAMTVTLASAADDKLAGVLAAQSDEVRARYEYRNPAETLEFFGVEPGMTVVDTIPGSVWYAGILQAYLGADGHVIGADYSIGAWSAIGYDGEEFLSTRGDAWVSKWPADAKARGGAGSAGVSAFVYGDLPDSMHGSADVVLFVRALHNMAYSTPDAHHLKVALQDAYDVLKPGGVVGIVQHHARDDMSDEWSRGDNGYLKKGYVIEMMENAGFEFVAASEVNANDRDRPSESDFVWRLPPSLSGSDDDPDKRAAMQAIGESNRMTLKFVKP